MALPDTLVSVERTPPCRQLATLRSGKYSCATARGGLTEAEVEVFEQWFGDLFDELLAIAATIFVRSPSASRSPKARFGSWDRSPGCSRRS